MFPTRSFKVNELPGTNPYMYVFIIFKNLYLRNIPDREDLSVRKVPHVIYLLGNKIIKSIIDISEGDLRKSINILQTLSLYDKKNLNDNICYDFYGIPSYNLMDEYFKILIDNNMDFKKKIDIFEEIMQKKQYNLKHFVNRIHKYIIKNIKTIDNNSDISNEPIKNILLDQDYLINLLDKLSIFEEQLNNTTFDDINYGSFLSLFNYKIV